MCGGQIATDEYPDVFDLYLHFGEERNGWKHPSTIPRQLRHGDGFNICLKYPESLFVITYAVLRKEALVKFLETDEWLRNNKHRVLLDPAYKQALVPVENKFGSMMSHNACE